MASLWRSSLIELFWWVLILILGFQIRKSWCIWVHSNYRNIETWNDLQERFSEDIMSTTDLNISSNTSQPYITSLHTSSFLSNVLFWLPHENISKQYLSDFLNHFFLVFLPKVLSCFQGWGQQGTMARNGLKVRNDITCKMNCKDNENNKENENKNITLQLK